MATVVTLDASCDLQQNTCYSTLPSGGRISLSISPRPFHPLQPLQIQVVMEQIYPQTVDVDFKGLNMYMGYNRTRLKKQSSGKYTGSGMLPSCAMEHMAWEATVMATTNKGILAVPFPFKTQRP